MHGTMNSAAVVMRRSSVSHWTALDAEFWCGTPGEPVPASQQRASTGCQVLEAWRKQGCCSYQLGSSILFPATEPLLSSRVAWIQRHFLFFKHLKHLTEDQYLRHLFSLQTTSHLLNARPITIIVHWDKRGLFLHWGYNTYLSLFEIKSHSPIKTSSKCI